MDKCYFINEDEVLSSATYTGKWYINRQGWLFLEVRVRVFLFFPVYFLVSEDRIRDVQDCNKRG